MMFTLTMMINIAIKVENYDAHPDYDDKHNY